MELASPAGSLEKLQFAYRYGADAAYIGFSGFSLRAKAENFSIEDASAVSALVNEQGPSRKRKLYCALNAYFRDDSLSRLEDSVELLSSFPFDAFIISDLGVRPFLEKHFPGKRLHLSTQANCTNAESAKMYRDLGFSRIILARELRLREIESIRQAVPDVELEAFAHGALCLAYSGRCLLSAWMADRSSNEGLCTHSCRWDWRLLEEKSRPGQYFPIYEGNGFSSILSSRDICMIDHVDKLVSVGLDSIKSEGRMKSLYYTAVSTQAYRAAIDKAMGGAMSPKVDDYEAIRAELFQTSHRPYTTGFYFDDKEVLQPALENTEKDWFFLGTVSEVLAPRRYRIILRNQIRIDEAIRVISPNRAPRLIDRFGLSSPKGESLSKADHGSPCILECDFDIEIDSILTRAALK
jgi:U32 family peptidase